MNNIPSRQFKASILCESKAPFSHNELFTSLFRHQDEALPRDHTQEIFSQIIYQLQRNNLLAALKSAELLCKKRPGNTHCLIEYARHLIFSGNSEKAEYILNKILEINSSNIEALKLYSYILIQQEKIPCSIEKLFHVVQKTPADSFAQINLNALRRHIRKPIRNQDTPFFGTTIATSLPPRNIETSRLAINSWLKLGFKVISVNTKNERDELIPHFPEVEFCTCENTARKECAGKDYQYLDSLLDALVAYGENVCGIINADIVLCGDQNSWNQVLDTAKDNFVFGSRINVGDLSQRHGLLLEPGFDFFIFPRDFLISVPRTGFVFGQPAWDLFFPAWATITNTPCAFCYSPTAMHVTHPMNWSPTANSRYIAMTLKWLAPNFADLIINYPGASVEYLRILTASITKILNRSAKGKAKPLFFGGKDINRLFAPVDPYYWAHSSDETLVLF